MTAPIHLYGSPINMGWGDKKLTAICREELGLNPRDGGGFLFYNRAKDQLRLFFVDADGPQMITRLLPENAFLVPVVPEGQKSVEVPRSLLAGLFKLS